MESLWDLLGTLHQVENYWGVDHEFVTILRPFYTTGDEYLIFDSSYDQGRIHSRYQGDGRSNNVPTLRKLLLFDCNLNKDAWSRMLQNNLSHLGKPYDYCFVLDNDDAPLLFRVPV